MTEVERKRLERFKKRFENQRGRRQPSKIPARLARTSAFAPKRTSLNTDSKFERLYVVPGHSIIRVSGRELGTQHRDAIYAVFRLPHSVEKRLRPVGAKGGLPFEKVYTTRTTWRGLLQAMQRTQHVNNLGTLIETFTDIQKVVFTIFEGDQNEVLKALESNDLGMLRGNGRGGMGSLIESVEWDGLALDSELVIRYGDWSALMIEAAKLVSLNADVQFRLKSDHAKTFWPYIDSMNNHSWVDEEVLAALAGRKLWDEAATKVTRGQFRKDCKQAFNDMIQAEGIVSWRVELRGAGRKKSRRYHYVRAQMSEGEVERQKTRQGSQSAAITAEVVIERTEEQLPLGL
ncbi:hypothetical protein [Aureimonas sp. AU20]|uniref:hypothetical protein n=1 Tax=Aureimonas sp. AU20 TaxID=1349819 RepID=UPI0007216756|nr:hypothetical protein [Aureimonas sp. AU20]ALN75777.1 hypothetical protein M673_23795 [Aureimonas sp. AU20]